MIRLLANINLQNILSIPAFTSSHSNIKQQDDDSMWWSACLAENAWGGREERGAIVVGQTRTWKLHHTRLDCRCRWCTNIPKTVQHITTEWTWNTLNKKLNHDTKTSVVIVGWLIIDCPNVKIGYIFEGGWEELSQGTSWYMLTNW